MTTDELLSRLAELGIRVVLGDNGKPRLKGDTSTVTPKLLKVLKWHRDNIIERMKPKPPREFLWRLGQTYKDVDNMPATWHPTGAWWWRYEGDTVWQPIPGTPGDMTELPKEST